jgi:ankyrin repeat protein
MQWTFLMIFFRFDLFPNKCYTLRVANNSKYSILLETSMTRFYWKLPGIGAGNCKNPKPVLLMIFVAVLYGAVSIAQENRNQATEKLKELAMSMVPLDIEEARRLIKAGADVNVRGKDGATPLYAASRHGYEKIVRLLLDAGADVSAATTNGATPLLIASHEGYTKIVKLLLGAAANSNAGTVDGVTPLILASRTGHTKILRLLLEAKADVNASITVRDNPLVGATPLYLATLAGHDKIVRLLLKANANANAGTSLGETPLFIAVLGKKEKIVRLLLEAKADVNAKAAFHGENCTPWDIAKRNNYSKIMQLLQAHGAK